MIIHTHTDYHTVNTHHLTQLHTSFVIITFMIYFLAAFKYTVSIVNCNRDYYLVIRSLCFLTTFTYLSHLQPPHYTITNGFSVSVSLILFSSVQFSPSVVSDSLRPHESQHARPPCPSPTPGVHSDSRPSSQ